VADRTNPGDKRAGIPCTAAVRDQVKAHKAELRRVLNRRATVGEIVGAWASGVPLWETAAMLDAYRPPEDSNESDSGDDGE
jgi:hypothetical protein